MPEIVFLDDDVNLVFAWQLVAKDAGKNLLSFTDASDFLQQLPYIPKNTPIYLDSELGNQKKGEMIAKDLYEQGYTELYLATGHGSDAFPEMPWIKKIVDKRPPF